MSAFSNDDFLAFLDGPSSSSKKRKKEKNEKREKKDKKKDKKMKKMKKMKMSRDGSYSPLRSYRPSPPHSPLPSAYTEKFTSHHNSKKVVSRKGDIANAKGFDTSKALKRKRKERFDNEYLEDLARKSSPKARVTPGPGEGFGTCGLLSKPYKRLTSAAKEEDVRPLKVLEQALAVHTARWENEEIGYDAFLDELKSIRQDLTVQSLTLHPLSSRTYYSNLLASLSHGDTSEFLVCTSQLVSPNCWRNLDHGERDVVLASKIMYGLHTGTLPAALRDVKDKIR